MLTFKLPLVTLGLLLAFPAQTTPKPPLCSGYSWAPASGSSDQGWGEGKHTLLLGNTHCLIGPLGRFFSIFQGWRFLWLQSGNLPFSTSLVWEDLCGKCFHINTCCAVCLCLSRLGQYRTHECICPEFYKSRHLIKAQEWPPSLVAA